MITSEQLALLHNLVDHGGRIVGVADLSPEELRLADDEKRIAVGHGFGIAWIPDVKPVRSVELPGLNADELAESSRRFAKGIDEVAASLDVLASDARHVVAKASGLIASLPMPGRPTQTPEIRMVEVYDVAAEACATWGPTAQATMIVEEVGEFLTAFARLSRDRATREQVIEEAADVIVVLGSALVLVGGKGNETLALLAEAVEGKVARLRERLARANS